MIRYRRAKRLAAWVSAGIGILFYSLLLILPAIGGHITAEQPAGQQ